MHRGYIKYRRCSVDNDLYFAEPFTRRQARQDLILTSNHKDGQIIVRGNIILLKRGQNGYSEETFAQRWKWSRNKVRRFLNYLETIQQIEQQKSKLKSIITILNWEKYQGNGTSDETTERHQTKQQTDTNKNVKKEKNDKKDISKDIQPTAEHGNPQVNELIERLKETCSKNGSVYDPEQERNFAKHILTAKSFGDFVAKLDKSRMQVAIDVLNASVQINFWRGYATGPKKIYKRYAEIYNERLKQGKKTLKSEPKKYNVL